VTPSSTTSPGSTKTISNREQVARCKMEGYTTEEIPQRLKCAPRWVKRKVQLIRKLWEKEGLS
jgi:hypothetical protein